MDGGSQERPALSAAVKAAVPALTTPPGGMVFGS